MEKFIRELRDKNIYLEVRDNELIIDAPKGALDDDTVNLLRSNKIKLMDFLGSKKEKKEIKNLIVKATPQKNYAISKAQKSFWIMNEINENAIFNNQVKEILHKNDFNSQALEHSLKYLIERHEILRTVFRKNQEGEVKQYILDPNELKFKIDYIEVTDSSEKKEQLNFLLKEELFKMFNLSEGPLFRLTVYFYKNSVVITQTIHHIISDRWSMLIFIRELLQIYTAFQKGDLNPLPILAFQYKDYSEWERNLSKGEDYFMAKDFFTTQFAGTLPILEFPTDKARPIQKSHKGRRIIKSIDKKLLNDLKLLSKNNEGTLYVSLLTIANILLHKYTGQTDIIIGFPVSGRDNVEFEDQLGVFMKTLGLRTQFKKQDSFENLFRQIKEVLFETLRYGQFPFDEFINELDHQRDIRRGSLFDVNVVLQNQNLNSAEQLTPERTTDKEELLTLSDDDNKVFSIMDLEFYFSETEGELLLNLIYNEDVFNYDTILQLANHFEQISRRVVSNSTIEIRDIDFMTDKEKEKVLILFNRKETKYSTEENFVSLFKKIVNTNGDKPAVIYNEKILTYSDLDKNSTKITNIINKKNLTKC